MSLISLNYCLAFLYFFSVSISLMDFPSFMTVFKSFSSVFSLSLYPLPAYYPYNLLISWRVTSVYSSTSQSPWVLYPYCIKVSSTLSLFWVYESLSSWYLKYGWPYTLKRSRDAAVLCYLSKIANFIYLHFDDISTRTASFRSYILAIDE